MKKYNDEEKITESLERKERKRRKIHRVSGASVKVLAKIIKNKRRR